MSMYHFSDTEAIEHDVNTVPDFGDFERVEIDGQWYVPERTCHPVLEDETLVCSECGEDIDGYGWNYCPNCGARVLGD